MLGVSGVLRQLLQLRRTTVVVAGSFEVVVLGRSVAFCDSVEPVAGLLRLPGAVSCGPSRSDCCCCLLQPPTRHVSDTYVEA